MEFVPTLKGEILENDGRGRIFVNIRRNGGDT